MLLQLIGLFPTCKIAYYVALLVAKRALAPPDTSCRSRGFRIHLDLSAFTFLLFRRRRAKVRWGVVGDLRRGRGYVYRLNTSRVKPLSYMDEKVFHES